MSFNRDNSNGCPCKDCDHRVPEPRCHMTCKDYLEWRKQVDIRSEKERACKLNVMSDAKKHAIWKKTLWRNNQGIHHSEKE